MQRFGAKRGRNLASAHAARGATPEERVEPCRRAVLGATAVAPEELRGPETALRQRLVRLDGLDDVENDFTEIAWAAVHEVDAAPPPEVRLEMRKRRLARVKDERDVHGVEQALAQIERDEGRIADHPK